ncbi:hypothetical protein [Mucilaginibacter sp.]|uniref:hypothetical protein n=1 Tax=Mucilaginibacter sp. TaxID=1882438 RepID=UPI0025E97B85|nr:hypothetical protein [Mucilaginibacter sp.]
MKVFCSLLVILLSATSCKTYYMTPASLTTQLENIKPEKITDAYDFRLGLTGVLLKNGKNFYNGIDSILVTDKDGKQVKIPVTVHTSLRLTDNTGQSVTVFFDSMFKKDSLIFASKSHFFNLPVKRNINSIKKIETQIN